LLKAGNPEQRETVKVEYPTPDNIRQRYAALRANPSSFCGAAKAPKLVSISIPIQPHPSPIPRQQHNKKRLQLLNLVLVSVLAVLVNLSVNIALRKMSKLWS
jgi:hypothetical protein